MGSKPKRRVRHHVNPLSFRRDVAIPTWSEVFPHPEHPLEVDVGCMHGTFMLERARRVPEHNFVGLEIRKPLVDEVRARIERDEQQNAHVVLCNANTSFTELFPPESVHRVYVHFPDPWFKKRHHKRRVVTESFVDDLRRTLVPAGEFRFMTDYADYAGEVVELMQGQPGFQNRYAGRAPAEEEGFPLTHREAWHSGKGDAVHRYVWVRR